MPLQLITPFDRDPDTAPQEPQPALPPAAPPDTQLEGLLAFSSALQADRQADMAPNSPAKRLLQIFADLCFILVKAGAFLGAIYLAVLGLPLLFFLLLTGGDMTLLFAQLGNLAAHYQAADHARQAAFANELKLAALGIATLAVIWRLPRFLGDVAAQSSREEDGL